MPKQLLIKQVPLNGYDTLAYVILREVIINGVTYFVGEVLDFTSATKRELPKQLELPHKKLVPLYIYMISYFMWF